MGKNWTEEERKAFGEKMKAAREAKDVVEEDVKILDLTKEHLVNESDFQERIRRLFDAGENPELIQVNTKQVQNILDTSENMSRRAVEDGIILVYESYLGDYVIEVVPAKEINEDN